MIGLPSPTSTHVPERASRRGASVAAARAALVLAVLTAFAAAGAAGAAEYSFQWANPTPQGNPLRGLAFEDASTGYAVGDLGTCLRTATGAASWTDQTAFPIFTTKLNDVIVVGPGEILAVGNSPGIFRSVDGGAAWSPVDNPSTGPLINVEEIASGVLSAVGEWGQVLRSTDAGATWSLLPHAGDGDLRAQFWLSESDGFVVGDFIARRTTDGGQTWNDLPGVDDPGVPLLTDVHFIDPLNGWILEHFTTYRTTDGGANWFERHVFFAGPIYQEEGVYISTSERIVVTNLEGAGIWRTTDDGMTWDLLYERATTAGYTDILELSGGDLVVCSTDGDLLRSTDGGDTWTNFTRSPEAAARNVLEAIAVHPAGLAFAGGRDDLWLRSTDGGSTWEIPAASPEIETANAIVLRDGGLGLAGGYEPPGQSKTHRTTDGGQTWTEHDIAGGYVGYPRGFAFPSDDVAYLVTSGGSEQNHVYRSLDGGETWQDRSNGIGGDLPLICVFFLDTDTGFVGGGDFAGDARIWKTTDAAAGWTPLPETGLDQAAIQDMHWMDELTGVVAGYDGVFRTTDGGQTWSEVLNEIGFFLDFRDPLHGVVASYFESSVWVTSDGGDTWEAVDLPWVGRPYAVEAVEGGIYACGEGSVVLRGEESGISSVDPDPPFQAAASLRAFPNPTGGGISFRFDNPAAGPVIFRILDVGGREMDRMTRVLQPGAVSIPFARDLAPGVYFVETSGPASRRGRFVVLGGK
jgi:photosystem II stability/assembly factor-like uncharacterized protein